MNYYSDKMLKVIFIDVDGTITEAGKPAWNIINLGLGVKEEDHYAIYHAFKNGLLTTNVAIRQMTDLWVNTGKATRKNIINVLEKNMHIRDGAYAFINKMTEKGIKIILLTGTPDVNLAVICRNLPGVESHTTSNFQFDENDELVWFTYPEDEVKMKVDYFNDYILNNNIDSNDCAMIGNGLNDMGVINLVGFSAAPRDGSEDEVLAKVDFIFDDYQALENKINTLI